MLTCRHDFNFDFYNILVRADATDHVGQTATLQAEVVPVGIGDATPADNAASIPLVVSGKVALSVVFSSPAGTKTIDNHIQTGDLPVGKPTTITMSVTNQGPDDGSGVLGFLNFGAQNAADFTVSFGPGLERHQASSSNSLPSSDASSRPSGPDIGLCR